MKQFFLLSIVTMILASINAQSNEYQFNEAGITFGNGTQIDGFNNTNIPPAGTNIFAAFSNGIQGDVTTSGYTQQVEIYTIDHFQYRPVNLNGLPVGSSPKNKYFSFRKPVDSASRDLANAFNQNSTITDITFNLIFPGNQGSLLNRFDIILSDVRIVEYWLDFDFSNNGNYQLVEKYLVSYSTYTILDVLNVTSTQINWQY